MDMFSFLSNAIIEGFCLVRAGSGFPNFPEGFQGLETGGIRFLQPLRLRESEKQPRKIQALEIVSVYSCGLVDENSR